MENSASAAAEEQGIQIMTVFKPMVFDVAGRITYSLKKIGGWSSYDAIEPYLAEPTEENIINSMSAAQL